MSLLHSSNVVADYSTLTDILIKTVRLNGILKSSTNDLSL